MGRRGQFETNQQQGSPSNIRVITTGTPELDAIERQKPSSFRTQPQRRSRLYRKVAISLCDVHYRLLTATVEPSTMGCLDGICGLGPTVEL